MDNYVSHVQSHIQVTYYGNLRTKAKFIWRGPRSIDIYQNNSTIFYGWSTLALELMGKGDNIECRTLYANMFDESQDFAILRTVVWNRSAIKEMIKDQPNNFELVLPAKFVIIPVNQLEKWLKSFNGIRTSIQPHIYKTTTNTTRRLKIERDYKSAIFEKTWEQRSNKYNRLNEKWEVVWNEMTQFLEREPIFLDFFEKFWPVIPNPHYNFNDYHPLSL